MENILVKEDTKDNLMFFSFIPRARQNLHWNGNDGSILITDSEDEGGADAEPQLELLCQVEFESGKALPLPIEQKVTYKAEIEDTTIQENTSLINASLNNKTQDQTANLDECEEELLPLCKIDPDYELDNNVAVRGGTTNSYILFVCPQCNSSFENSASWREHIAKMHGFQEQRTLSFFQCSNNNEFKCKKCQMVITRCTLKVLEQHFFSHLPYKVYKCKLCRYDARSLYLMISHIMKHKEKEELSLCGAPTNKSEATTLQNATLEHESRQFIAYICPVCGQTFDVKENWHAHINFQHNFLEKTAENRFKNHFKCTECSVEIFSQHIPDLQHHLFTHFPYKSFLKCKLCGFTISRHNFMISHIYNLHKAHLSLEATTSILVATQDKEHSVVNSGNFEYDSNDDCDDNRDNVAPPQVQSTVRVNPKRSTRTRFSGRNLSSQSSLNISNASQEVSTTTNISTTNANRKGKSGFRCCGCSRYFKTADERNEHNIVAHPKYTCELCSRPFAKKNDLKRHACDDEYIEKQCNICHKIYNYEKCYQIHVQQCRKSNHMRTAKKNRKSLKSA